MAHTAPLTRLAAGTARRMTPVSGRALDENSHFELAACTDRKAWLQRAEYLRRRILCCCGLWPVPERQPLNARIFGMVEHDGYATEKVYFESRPGFFVTGNLYRPLEEGPPRPAVLCPHGHWTHGRLEDSDACSVPARCATFARQRGMSPSRTTWWDTWTVARWITPSSPGAHRTAPCSWGAIRTTRSGGSMHRECNFGTASAPSTSCRACPTSTATASAARGRRAAARRPSC